MTAFGEKAHNIKYASGRYIFRELNGFLGVVWEEFLAQTVQGVWQ